MSHTEDVFLSAGMQFDSSQALSFWDLAMFNSEKARGLVHTPEYCEKMMVRQEQYNKWLGDRPRTEGWT